MLQPHLNHDAIVLIGRVLLSSLFLQSAVSKSLAWSAALDEVQSFGLPRRAYLLVPALAVQYLGGVCIAIGVLTFWSATALIVFLLPTTFLAHGFWRYAGADRAHHVTGFFQNFTMIGGLVLLLTTGPGAWSIDSLLHNAGAS